MADTHLPPPKPIDAAGPGPTSTVGDRRVARSARRGRDRMRAIVVRRIVRERRLGRLLDRELGPVAIVLHDRQTGAGGRIDHLVVAASGVWVIDARHAAGKVERERIGRRRTAAWLHLRNGQRVPIVEEDESIDVVQGHLDRMGFGWLDVRPVVCLTNANWDVLRKPFEVDAKLVTWGRALVETIGVPGPLGPFDMRAVAIELSTRLPAAR
jgi:hypothetical protein